jgi:hypothetical protein
MQETSKKVHIFIESMNKDFNNIKFKRTKNKIKLSIGKFSLSRRIGDDYNYAVKKLFEDFLTNTSVYYIKNFWRE